ncbi:probable Nischarin at N-terminal half [Coccomyxa sp. Obi]|nr:probable Nischarin at N-terminal half [Coccomyxa sp. Obi]
MSGSLTLSLHPRGLEHIAARLSRLDELEKMKQRSPVDFFRGCVSDVQDFKRLEKIQHVLQRVRKLRVHSVACKLRDPTRVNLSPLHSLSHLELTGCDLSTSAWLGIESVRGTLRSIACHNSLEELWHLLAPASSRAKTPSAAEAAAAWPSLTTLACSRNCFDTMDASLALLPAVERLDLSSNNIATVQNLTACAALAELDLSNNCIASLAQVGLCAGPLRHLVLQGNVIKSTKGLQLLRGLEELDLRCNLIASIHEVVRLSGMSTLRALWLEDNPIAFARLYRIDVLGCFPEAQHLLLDGRPSQRSEIEIAALRAQGNAPPDSWRVMERFVSQANHFFPWGPPVYREHPLSEELWSPGSPTASSIEASLSAATSSASHTGSRGRSGRKAPARRIVEFSLGGIRTGGQSSTSQDEPGSPSVFPTQTPGNRGAEASGSGRQGLRSVRLASHQSSSSQGDDTKYYDVRDRQRSPPRYERAVLERLHEVLPAPGKEVVPADTGWESGSDTPSNASSANSDDSVSPELQRSTSRLLSGSLQLGFMHSAVLQKQ